VDSAALLEKQSRNHRIVRAEAAGVREIAIFAAASETFSKENINQTIDESLATYRGVTDEARSRGIRVAT